MSLPALLALALAASPAAPAPAPIRLDEALQAAEQSPAVAAAREALSQKKAYDARLSPLIGNPQLALQPGYRVKRPGDRGLEAQLSLTQPFSLSGLRGKRDAAVRSEEDVLQAELRAARLSERLQMLSAWIGLWIAERAHTEALGEREVAQAFVARIERMVQAGVLTRADLSEARAYLGEARLLALSTEGALFEQRLALARRLGRPASVPQTAGDPPEAPVPDEARAGALLQQVGKSASALVAAAKARAEAARMEELLAARGASVQLGATVLRDSPDGLVLFGNATFTLPFFDRGERDLGSLAATQAQREGERQTAELDSAQMLSRALHETAHSAEVLAVVRDELLPAAQQSVLLRERQLEAGETTLLEVLTARRTARAAAGRLWQARGAHLLARLEAAELVSALQDLSNGSHP